MRATLMLEGQEGVTWQQWLAIARTRERLGLDSLVTSDHYLSVVATPEPGSHDAWTLLGALAASTEHLRLGTMVSPVTFRLPTVLAKAATTVDRISDGRVELGLGAGWWEEEHRTHGIPFPPAGVRMQMLEEQLEIVHGLWSNDEYSFTGRHYTIDRCRFVHRPLQLPHPPIVIGGKGGPRMAQLVARWAGEFNRVGGTPDDVRASFERVRAAVERAGREPSSMTTSLMTWVFVGRHRRRVEGSGRTGPPDGSFRRTLRGLPGGHLA